MDEEAFKRHAHLSGGRERAVDQDVERLGDIGVIEQDHRILTAQFERARDQPFGAVRGDLATGRRAAGEHHRVDVVNQRRASYAAVSGDDLKHVVRQAALAQQL